jgi:hypothetical protein
MIFDHKQQMYALRIKNMQANQIETSIVMEHHDSLSVI